MNAADVTAKKKIMVIMRGLPGSGKSSVAKLLYDGVLELKNSCIIHSTDNFHLELKDGKMVYVFKPEKLGAFHKANLDHATASMQIGVDVVVIDNTNTTWKEIKPYVEAALDNGYDVGILDPVTTWAFDVNECAKKKHSRCSQRSYPKNEG